jgi:hypothetical protein
MSFSLVNGFICHNCTDIDYAKRHVDPQHPKDGPYGIDKDQAGDHGPAVTFGGSLADPSSRTGVSAVNPVDASQRPPEASDQRPGGRIDISA